MDFKKLTRVQDSRKKSNLEKYFDHLFDENTRKSDKLWQVLTDEEKQQALKMVKEMAADAEASLWDCGH